uniref:DNA methyltransferase 1-associated protein 1 n=1 Tax=Meloidogyne incognita TaxID=6306 RepID=A0A914MEU1_MELIC
MMTGDAQDILGTTSMLRRQQSSTLPNLNLTNVDKKTIKKSDQIKRPAGMHRELFNLFVHQGKDNNKEKIESLAPTNTKHGYSVVKADFGKRIVRKWMWKPFMNDAREDGLQLSHWEREDLIGQPYQFARFNKQLDPVTFTDMEYDEYLDDERWNKEETIHLLDLCHRFDLRWPIVEDRFDRERFKDRKSVEDMKERYYGIVNELNVARNTQSEPLAYDAEHERRRKEQLVKLWNRTEEQIKEEEELKEAVRKIEAKRKEREKKAHDLQRLINATAERISVSPDSSTCGSPSVVGGTSTSSRAAHRRSLKRLRTQASLASDHLMPSEPHIRWPEYRQPGPHLRTQEMKLPSNTAQRKLNNIGMVVTSLQIVSIGLEYPPATEEIVKLYNDFRSNIVLLQELKTAVYNTEQELDQLSNRLRTEKNIELSIEPRLRVSEAFYEEFTRNPASLNEINSTEGEGKSSGKSGGKGGKQQKQLPKLAPVTSRRITRMIETNPISMTQTRKKRTTITAEGTLTRSSIQQ